MSLNIPVESYTWVDTLYRYWFDIKLTCENISNYIFSYLFSDIIYAERKLLPHPESNLSNISSYLDSNII